MNSPSNQFLTTLQKHRSGGLLADASTKLAELVAGVHATGKRGRMTITLSVVPASAGQSCITFHDDIKTQVPRQPMPSSLWFTQPDGSLVKENPAQAEMAPIVAMAEASTAAPIANPVVRAVVNQ